jgi:hypothetical protein
MNIHRVTSGESEQGTPTRYKLQAKCGCRPFNTSNLEDIFLSEKAEFRTAGSGVFRVPDDSHTDDIWYSPLWYSRNSSSTLFPLHEACIETSCRAIDHLLSQRADIEHEPTLAFPRTPQSRRRKSGPFQRQRKRHPRFISLFQTLRTPKCFGDDQTRVVGRRI